MTKGISIAVVTVMLAGSLPAQVFSPKVLLAGQVDTTDLRALAEGIYRATDAATPRQKAEAIWRFFLTDGRFVPPGFWYHIAGWAYEEPTGEVLDPLKLLNSYGFGLCYHIAPLLQAVYQAGGFEDARVWFLTGHTVTEVFYDGAYHYYDSDMLGYSTVGRGDPKELPVASVTQIARDGAILTGKLKSAREADSAQVDSPWYPADVREGAIGGLADLFTSTSDNWLYADVRYPQGHSMDYVLRPGERITRLYEPEEPGLFYLPFAFDGSRWAEVPRAVKEYSIRTEDGPRSQKDTRRWATGRIEYTPALSDPNAFYDGVQNLRLSDPRSGRDYLSRERGNEPGAAVFEIASPWVLIDAGLTVEALAAGKADSLEAAVSADAGRSWESMGARSGPFRGKWEAKLPVRQRSAHGALTPVTGEYGFLVRLRLLGPGAADAVRLTRVEIAARFQHNPRTLPALRAGDNDLRYRTGTPQRRRTIPVRLEQIDRVAMRRSDVRRVSEDGQDILWPSEGRTGEVLFCLAGSEAGALAGFDAGARFLDIRNGLAPDKLTAETRSTKLGAAVPDSARRAAIAWSTSPTGPFATLWEYRAALPRRDGQDVQQVLRWPEVDRTVSTIPAGIDKLYVRYTLANMGMDSVRLAARLRARPGPGALEITHVWRSGGVRREHTERLHRASDYRVRIDAGDVVNHALILYCPPGNR